MLNGSCLMVFNVNGYFLVDASWFVNDNQPAQFLFDGGTTVAVEVVISTVQRPLQRAPSPRKCLLVWAEHRPTWSSSRSKARHRWPHVRSWSVPQSAVLPARFRGFLCFFRLREQVRRIPKRPKSWIQEPGIGQDHGCWILTTISSKLLLVSYRH